VLLLWGLPAAPAAATTTAAGIVVMERQLVVPCRVVVARSGKEHVLVGIERGVEFLVAGLFGGAGSEPTPQMRETEVEERAVS